MDPVQAELLNALSILYRSGKYSDLTVICNSNRYKVHKALLCSRSRFFDAACSSSFLESRNGEINLSQEDPEVVAHLIDYFYYLNYDMDNQDDEATPPSSFTPTLAKIKELDASHASDPLVATASTISPPSSRPTSPNIRPTEIPTPMSADRPRKVLSRRQMQMRRRPRTSSSSSARDSPPPLTPTSRTTDPSDQDDMDMSDGYLSDEDECQTPRLVLHARIYAAAEKYGIPGLKMLSKLKFETRLCPPSLDAFNASPLGNQGQREDFLCDELPSAIEEVYTGTIDTDRGLRNVIMQAFRAHPEWGRRAEIADVIREHGTLGYDLYRISSGMPLR